MDGATNRWKSPAGSDAITTSIVDSDISIRYTSHTTVDGPGFDPFLLLIALVAMALCMVGVLATVYWLRKGHKMDDNDPKKWTVTNRGRLYSEQPYV